MYKDEKKGILAIPFIITLTLISILTLLYLLTDTESTKLTILIILILTLLVGIFYFYWQLSFKTSRLRKSLQKLENHFNEEELDELKLEYNKAYLYYTKLSEKQKQNFYPRLTTVRESIERFLLAEKKLQELLEQEKKASLKERQELLEKINESYNKLPKKTQEHYFPHVSHLKDQLERGK